MRSIVGIADPFNDEPLRALAYLTAMRVSPRLFVPADFDKAYQALYVPSAAEEGPLEVNGSAEASEIDVQRLRDMASEAPTIRLVNQIIANAVEVRASDIHLEPTVDGVLVRYRIDGMLRTAQTLSPDLRAVVTSRIKIMSGSISPSAACLRTAASRSRCAASTSTFACRPFRRVRRERGDAHSRPLARRSRFRQARLRCGANRRACRS